MPHSESMSVDFFDQHLSKMMVAPSFEQGPPTLPAGAGWHPEPQADAQKSDAQLRVAESEASTQSSDGRGANQVDRHMARHHSGGASSHGEHSEGNAFSSMNVGTGMPAPPPQHAAPAPPPAAPAPKFDAMASMAAPPQAMDPMVSQAPMSSQMPMSSGTGRYRVGDQVEVWSNSHKRWSKGSIQEVDGGSVKVKYHSPEGAAMVKQMPEGHEHLRFASADTAAAEEASTGPFKVGDQIEIWSNSNQSWCKGSIDKIQGDLVNVKYQSPDGQTMTKLMPNGHEFLRHLNQQAIPPPPPPPGRSMDQAGEVPPPLPRAAESACRESDEDLAVYQDACDGAYRSSSAVMSSAQGAPTASMNQLPKTKGYTSRPAAQSHSHAKASTQNNDDIFVAESTSWVPNGAMMCGMPIKATKKQEVALNDDGTPVARCRDTDRCCRCSMPIGSYFDHTCPRCAGVVCHTCLDDVKFIIDSYRCPCCGDQEHNLEALKQTLWYMNMYRNAQRAVGAVPILFAGLLGYGPEGPGHAKRTAKQVFEAEEPAPVPQVQPAPAQRQAANGPPPAPPKPKVNGAVAAAAKAAAAAPPGAGQDVPEHHTRPPAGWLEGAGSWAPGNATGGAPPAPAAPQNSGPPPAPPAPQQAQQQAPEQVRRNSQQGAVQRPNPFSSQQMQPQRGANPLGSANGQSPFSTRIPPDQMSPMR